MKLIALSILAILSFQSSAMGQPAPDPAWQGTILISLTPDADPALQTALSESKLMQALSTLAPAAGRRQPAEILHLRLGVDGDKALIEARWFEKPTADHISSAIAAAMALDTKTVVAGITITIFPDKAAARNYFEANLYDWIARLRTP